MVLLAIFFFFKRATITLDSFVTQIMGWMIISLGIYHLVDLPKMVDITLRKDVLYVWCSFTMVFNLVYFFFDTRGMRFAQYNDTVISCFSLRLPRGKEEGGGKRGAQKEERR